LRVLLDTCTLIWLAGGAPHKISKPATAALNDPSNELLVSDASFWEIILKHARGKLPLPSAPKQWVPDQIYFYRLTPIQISRDDLIASAELPKIHFDPFDRLIAMQSILRGLTVLSPDPAFQTLGATMLW
jgi:PIN domain nuclease of toxin-antitoxin system